MAQETFNLKKGNQLLQRGGSILFILMGVVMFGFIGSALDEGIGIVLVLVIISLVSIGFGILIFKSASPKSSFVIISEDGINVANKIILSYSDILDAYEEEVITKSRGITLRKMHVFAKYFDQEKNAEKISTLFHQDYEGYTYMREKLLKNVRK